MHNIGDSLFAIGGEPVFCCGFSLIGLPFAGRQFAMRPLVQLIKKMQRPTFIENYLNFHSVCVEIAGITDLLPANCYTNNRYLCPSILKTI